MVVIDGVDLDALDYIVKVPYNGTIATGGDSLTENLNIWYEVRCLPPSANRHLSFCAIAVAVVLD
jgi:hypothetical protein